MRFFGPRFVEPGNEYVQSGIFQTYPDRRDKATLKEIVRPCRMVDGSDSKERPRTSRCKAHPLFQ
jgi:hypothetical protein